MNLASCGADNQTSIYLDVDEDYENYMASNITPVDVFTTVITVPDAGDAGTALSVETPIQANANRSENNNSRLNDNDTLLADAEKFPRLNTVTAYMLPMTSAAPVDTGGTVEWEFNSNNASWVAATATGSELFMDITHLLPPVGATLDTLTAYVNGGTGHGALPANMPIIGFARIAKASGSPTVIATQVDTSADFTAYELDHTIALTGAAHTTLADNRYVVIVTGEGGANAIADQLKLFALEIGWTP